MSCCSPTRSSRADGHQATKKARSLRCGALFRLPAVAGDSGATTGIRTLDLSLTKDALYH